jgi:hypothetical protein
MGHGYHQAAHWPAQLEVPDSADVTLALKRVQQIAPEQWVLPPTCLVIVNGRHLGTVARCESCVLCAGDELTLLAPVAGG